MLPTKQNLDKETLDSLVQTCEDLSSSNVWGRTNTRPCQPIVAIAADGSFIDTSLFSRLADDISFYDSSSETAHYEFQNGVNNILNKGVATLLVNELSPKNMLAALCFAFLGKTTIVTLDVYWNPVENSKTGTLPPTCSEFLRASDWQSLIFCNCKTTELASALQNLFPKSHCAKNHLSKLQPWLSPNKTTNPCEPLFSIVVPTLGEPELVRCLTSVIKQSFYRYEVLVIKSASNAAEGTALPNTKLSRSLGLSSHVKQIEAYDSGPYDAMNLGLTLARAPWTYFLGSSDTLFSRGTLMTVARLITHCPTTTHLVYGAAKMIGQGPGTYDGQVWGEFFNYDRLRFNNVCHQSIFYKTQALRDIGGYDPRFPICADWNANLQLWNRANPVFVDTVIANFQRGGLSTHSEDEAFNRERDDIWLKHREVTK